MSGLSSLKNLCDDHCPDLTDGANCFRHFATQGRAEGDCHFLQVTSLRSRRNLTHMKRIILVAVVLGLSAVTAVAQSVNVDVDSTANFSSFKTFGWDKGMVTRNPIISALIVTAVESELTRRGLTKADKPDLKVAVAAAAGADIQAVGPTWNNAQYQVWGGYTNPAALMTVVTGTLLVDLIDTKTDRSVLRGVAKHTLNRSASGNEAADAKSVEKPIKKAVSKMFEKYPAGSKK